MGIALMELYSKGDSRKLNNIFNVKDVKDNPNEMTNSKNTTNDTQGKTSANVQSDEECPIRTLL